MTGRSRSVDAPGHVDRHETCVGGKRRRLPALLEPRNSEYDGQARGEDVDRNAAHDLVAPMRDAGKTVQQRQALRDQDAGDQPGDRRAGHRGGGRRGEGSREHLAFQPDIDQP